MSVKIRCPHCRATLNVNDPRPGRRVRCGGCERMFPIPSDGPDDIEPLDDRLVPGDELAGRRKAAVSRRRDEDERPVRRRGDADEAPSGGLPTWLIVGGAITAVLLIGVVGVGGLAAFWFFARSAPVPAAPAVAMAAPPPAPGGGGGVVAPPPAGGGAGGMVPVPAPAGAALRYRWQGTPAVYAVKVMLENDKDYEVHRGYTTVTAKPGPKPAGAKAENKGTGTGFVVHADGYLITCAHVVENATKIEVAIGGKAFPATVKAVDHEQDLALIQIPTTGLPTVPLADSETAELGTEVWAVGFPLASVLGESVKITRGTLAGINRPKDGPKVFQIDAAINPGNSGGPLFTATGAVLGVNKSKLVGEDINNVGFATPTNEVAKMLRGQGVAFANANAAARLDGPALIRQVGPAVALITVTSVPAETFTVGFLTNLTKASFPVAAGGPAPGLPTPAFGGMRGEIDADTQGELSGPPRNDVRLPALLGSVGRFLIEPLGSGSEPTWRKTSGWVISYSDDGGGGFPGFPGRMRPPIPRPPFGPFGRPAAEPKKQLAVERSTYTRGAVAGDLITIEKRFELKADADAAKNIPGLTFTATKTIVFDAKAGRPKSMEFKGVLVESEKNKEFRLPVTVSYTLVEGEDRDRVLNVKAPPPPPPPPPAAPLTEADLTAALKDVAGTDRIKRGQAINQLKNAKPEARKEEVAKVLAGVVADPKMDIFHRRACADALVVWGTATSVPGLLPLLDSTDVFLRKSVIRALGGIKDERAAEPLAKRLPDGFDRGDASAALQAIGTKAEKPVAAQLTHSNWVVRLEAAKILKVIGTKASKEALEKAAEEDKKGSGIVTRAAQEALAEIAKR